MIVTYEKAGKFPCSVCVPSEASWKLEVDMGTLPDASREYVLKLTTGEFEDVVATSSDFYGLVDTGGDEEDEAIMALLFQMVNAAAKETVRVVQNKESVVDLSKVVQAELSFWIKFWESINPQEKEVVE